MLVGTEAGPGQWLGIWIVSFRINQGLFDLLNWDLRGWMYNIPKASDYEKPSQVKHTWGESSIKAENREYSRKRQDPITR